MLGGESTSYLRCIKFDYKIIVSFSSLGGAACATVAMSICLQMQ